MGAAILIFLAGVARGLSFFTPGGTHVSQMATMALRFSLGLLALIAGPSTGFGLLILGYASIALTDPWLASWGGRRAISHVCVPTNGGRDSGADRAVPARPALIRPTKNIFRDLRFPNPADIHASRLLGGPNAPAIRRNQPLATLYPLAVPLGIFH